MVYGMDYAAEKSVYERIKNKIIDGINEIHDIEFVPTNELAKIKKVDPLGITDLRVRGMWQIDNPFKVFDYVYQRDNTKQFNFMSIIRDDKYNSFDNTKIIEEKVGIIDGFNISNIRIKNPNNPACLENAKLITLQI